MLSNINMGHFEALYAVSGSDIKNFYSMSRKYENDI